MTDRIPLADLTSDQLDALYDQLEALRAVARGYCPACGRGDAAPTVTDWEQQKQRAEAAEARVADYENRITWHTTCESCAHLLDSSIRETELAERAERALARVRDLAARIRAGAAPRNLDDLADRIERAAATEATHPTSPKDTP